MKKFLIILVLACGGFMRSGAQSMLKVRLADNSPINVSLDGRYFNKRGTSVTVGDLPPGRHLLQIYAVSQTARRGRSREDIIYEGKVKTHDGMVTILQYDPSSDAIQVDEQEMNQYLNEHPIPSGGQGTENQEQGNNASSGNNDNSNTEPAAPGASPAPTGTLADNKIDQLKTQVTGKKTDTEIMKILKEGLGGETYTTYQVGTMMDWFSFESSKVDFVEWAYPKTVDKDFYNDLETKLTYKNYRDDLDKFINTQK